MSSPEICTSLVSWHRNTGVQGECDTHLYTMESLAIPTICTVCLLWAWPCGKCLTRFISFFFFFLVYIIWLKPWILQVDILGAEQSMLAVHQWQEIAIPTPIFSSHRPSPQFPAVYDRGVKWLITTCVAKVKYIQMTGGQYSCQQNESAL